MTFWACDFPVSNALAHDPLRRIQTVRRHPSATGHAICNTCLEQCRIRCTARWRSKLTANLPARLPTSPCLSIVSLCPLVIPFWYSLNLAHISMGQYISFRFFILMTTMKKVTYVLCTNSRDLSDHLLRLCSKYHVFISTSLDGPEHVHNHNRGKSDSYQRVIAGIQKARDYLGIERVSALDDNFRIFPWLSTGNRQGYKKV